MSNQQKLLGSTDNGRQLSDTEEIEVDRSYNGSNWFPIQQN